jgi:tRNA (mo5U34)-methyltransferase
MATTITQDVIDQIEWYHEFDFGGGLTSKPKTEYAEAHRKVWDFIRRELDKIDFAGKSVLDIGCWDGYWSFYAERRGSRSVLASDDASQNWSSGRGLLLAKQLLNSSIDVDQSLSVYDLGRLDRRFDIILCLGVYYHLIDPYYAFAQIRHRCHEGTVVVLEGDATVGIRPDTYWLNFLHQFSTNFIPSPYGLREMLGAAYLEVVSQTWMQRPRPPSLASRIRLAVAPYDGDTKKLTPPGKTSHVYKPPFGLDRYDTRYRSADD